MSANVVRSVGCWVFVVDCTHKASINTETGHSSIIHSTTRGGIVVPGCRSPPCCRPTERPSSCAHCAYSIPSYPRPSIRSLACHRWAGTAARHAVFVGRAPCLPTPHRQRPRRSTQSTRTEAPVPARFPDCKSHSSWNQTAPTAPSRSPRTPPHSVDSPPLESKCPSLPSTAQTPKTDQTRPATDSSLDSLPLHSPHRLSRRTRPQSSRQSFARKTRSSTPRWQLGRPHTGPGWDSRRLPSR